ncbi:hypothetical protein [Stenomitos frigidus]|uniref:Uncharacterized protein n=1 Tax=Stenomitos frigidus ULC18 TaxID=2107698 RepID=A0A2T1EBL9_9CYAN|nr:hypothetical protein [Stenomitos frigidus]PSB30152.1 hypothetical protein C7B82_09350 [Stenomitos frigidus ULC18]
MQSENQEKYFRVNRNTLGRSRKEMWRLFKSVVGLGAFKVEKGSSKSIKVRAERHISVILGESRSEREFSEKIERLEKDFVLLAENIIRYWDDLGASDLNASSIKRFLEYLCCEKQLEFQFLCSTIICPDTEAE